MILVTQEEIAFYTKPAEAPCDAICIGHRELVLPTNTSLDMSSEKLVDVLRATAM